MKKAAALFMVIIILMQCSIKLAIVAYYQFNKSYIVANFCENKAKPAMHCNGKCYLTKQIKAQEKQEEKVPAVLKGLKEILLFCSHYACSFSNFSLTIRESVHSLYLIKHSFSAVSGIFQPPR